MANYGMSEVPNDLGERIQQVIDRLDVFHHGLRDVEKRIEGVEKMADRANLPRVKFAARDAFSKISDAGAKLVDTHLRLAHILSPPREGRREHE